MRDITKADIALIELAKSGATDAPGDVLKSLKAAGHLTLKSGAKLTESGRLRAEKLKPIENDLRRLFAGGGLTTAASSGMRIGNGGSKAVRIHKAAR